MSEYPAIAPSSIYLPRAGVELYKWAVVACDQYTSQPDYWKRVEARVGDAPSALNIVYPEIYLSEGDARIPRIHSFMRGYIETGVLERAVERGFVLTERVTQSGARAGIVAAVDLDEYDYSPGAQSAVRATEGTILERIPPRVKIREGAPLECPHVMLLIDDAARGVIEPIYARRDKLRALYDTRLMENGGALRGWALEADEDTRALASALNALNKTCGGFLYAVGDGNHSLATAKACWEALKPALNEAERRAHPARYALAEIVNLHSDALRFKPIHRALFGARAGDVVSGFLSWLAARDMGLEMGESITFISGAARESYDIAGAGGVLPVAILQSYLDEYMAANPSVSIDYIHGEAALNELCQAPDTVGVLLTSIDKSSLFTSIKKRGVLPRKTFSMGEANEKRYYMECRSIQA